MLDLTLGAWPLALPSPARNRARKGAPPSGTALGLGEESQVRTENLGPVFAREKAKARESFYEIHALEYSTDYGYVTFDQPIQGKKKSAGPETSSPLKQAALAYDQQMITR
ncbi:hypothetical protein ACJZ2D_010913 [Fusarium nematophilum]